MGLGSAWASDFCAKPGVAANIITTNVQAMAIAVAIRRKRSSPIVCRVLESCEVQHMTTFPKRVAERWNATQAAARAAICSELSRRVNGLARYGRGYCPGLWFHGHRSQIAILFARPWPEIRARLANARFSCCNIGHNRNWRSAVRFATLRFKTRTDFRKPVCGVAREKSGRVFFVSSGGD
ncbi:hypothetical protein ACVW0I_003753 [Bradyrhizobium sp. LM6.11]